MFYISGFSIKEDWLLEDGANSPEPVYGHFCKWLAERRQSQYWPTKEGGLLKHFSF